MLLIQLQHFGYGFGRVLLGIFTPKRKFITKGTTIVATGGGGGREMGIFIHIEITEIRDGKIVIPEGLGF